MNDTLANAPLGQYADQLLGLDCIPAVDLGKQGHSDTGNGGVEEYGKVSRRELGIDWHRGNPSLRTRQLPAERTEAVGRVNDGILIAMSMLSAIKSTGRLVTTNWTRRRGYLPRKPGSDPVSPLWTPVGQLMRTRP